MEFTADQIASLLGGEVKGDGGVKINMLAKIQNAKSSQISFLSNPKYENYLYSTKASAVIVKKGLETKQPLSTTLIMVEDPYSAFTALLEEYHKFLTFQKAGIEEPSFIGKNSSVGDEIYRGAFSYIGDNVNIGKNVKIYPHTYVGDNVTVGDNTVLNSGVKLYPNSVVGNNCVLHSGVVIGSDGFGFAPQADGTYKTIPQLGSVIIGDNVDIGANTVVDCATFHGDATRIGNGVKLDNLIQIAHNVEIGKNTVIAAQTGVSGSSIIGENCVIAGQVGIAGHIVVAHKTSIGAKAGLGKSIKKEGEKLMGVPAFDVKEFFRSYAAFKNLPDLSWRLKQLEEKISDLTHSKSL